MKNKTISGNTNKLLRRVSRSFYMTLRVLPRAIRPQLSLTYMLARAADTVADTAVITVDKRQEVLSALCRNIQAVCAGKKSSIPDIAVFLRDVRSAQPESSMKSAKEDAELTLLENFETLLDALLEFSESDREKICTVLETITCGQQADIRRFGTETGGITALDTDNELDAYTYEVAGCVGEFWTRLCLAHIFPRAALDEAQLMSDAIRFGKGLQLVNILRDLPEDLRQGRGYIPKQSLLRFGLTPDDLLNQDAMSRFQPLYNEYLELAEECLRDGWRYTTSLPFRFPFGYARLRLACAWSILIGVKTLRRLRGVNILEYQRVKITRKEIRRILVESVLLYPCHKAWNRLFDNYL